MSSNLVKKRKVNQTNKHPKPNQNTHIQTPQTNKEKNPTPNPCLLQNDTEDNSGGNATLTGHLDVPN